MIWAIEKVFFEGKWAFSVGVVTWTVVELDVTWHHWTRGILAGAGTGEGNVGLICYGSKSSSSSNSSSSSSSGSSGSGSSSGSSGSSSSSSSSNSSNSSNSSSSTSLEAAPGVKMDATKA